MPVPTAAQTTHTRPVRLVHPSRRLTCALPFLALAALLGRPAATPAAFVQLTASAAELRTVNSTLNPPIYAATNPASFNLSFDPRTPFQTDQIAKFDLAPLLTILAGLPAGQGVTGALLNLDASGFAISGPPGLVVGVAGSATVTASPADFDLSFNRRMFAIGGPGVLAPIQIDLTALVRSLVSGGGGGGGGGSGTQGLAVYFGIGGSGTTANGRTGVVTVFVGEVPEPASGVLLLVGGGMAILVGGGLKRRMRFRPLL